MNTLNKQDKRHPAYNVKPDDFYSVSCDDIAIANIIGDIKNNKYNSIHQYRRDGDEIRLYYNTETTEFHIVAVKPGDNLTNKPFNLQSSFIVTEEVLSNPPIAQVKGLVPVEDKYLVELNKMGILSDELVSVIGYCKKNVGFYI